MAVSLFLMLGCGMTHNIEYQLLAMSLHVQWCSSLTAEQ